jgi:hypothetical protein
MGVSTATAKVGLARPISPDLKFHYDYDELWIRDLEVLRQKQCGL